MISVILCTYNRAESLRSALKSLESLDVPPGLRWELILVDNNSKDNTNAVVSEFERAGRLPIVRLFEGQQGKSYALNAGIKAARGSVLAFTDDDVTFDPQWLVKLSDPFNGHDCGAVGGRIVPVWTVAKPSWFVAEGPYRLAQAIVSFDHGETIRRLDVPPFGANMAIKKELFDRFGLFRTDLGPTAGKLMRGEDTELCRRLLQDEIKILYAPEAIVYHPVEPFRAEKKYFLDWYFDFGRIPFVQDGIPSGSTRLFGVPGYLLKALLHNAALWVVTFNSQRRFFRKLAVYETAGAIAQAYGMKTRT